MNQSRGSTENTEYRTGSLSEGQSKQDTISTKQQGWKQHETLVTKGQLQRNKHTQLERAKLFKVMLGRAMTVKSRSLGVQVRHFHNEIGTGIYSKENGVEVHSFERDFGSLSACLKFEIVCYSGLLVLCVPVLCGRAQKA